MEVTKKPKIKSIPYEEFTDNETLEKLVRELNAGGANVAIGVLDDFIDWGRSNSLWPLTFATSCCGIEFMALGAARYDMARFGFEVARASPRQADMIMVCGTITNKMAPVLKRLYDQMADPKYVIAVGGCAVRGGRIRVVWKRTGTGAVLTVADTGIGISPEHLPRITERFYRVDKGRSRDTGGTGLGLAIVKHVMRRAGGELSIESTPGEGSKFMLRFPEERIFSGRYL